MKHNTYRRFADDLGNWPWKSPPNKRAAITHVYHTGEIDVLLDGDVVFSVTISDVITLDSNGAMRPALQKFLNSLLPDGVRIKGKGNVWYVKTSAGLYEFYDLIQIDADGDVITDTTEGW